MRTLTFILMILNDWKNWLKKGNTTRLSRRHAARLSDVITGCLTMSTGWQSVILSGRNGVGYTIDKDGAITEEVRYFIFSFKKAVETFARCVRGHWSVESMHWLLDVVYREDHNQTLDKRAAFNLNAIRKLCLYFLKVMQFEKKDLSFRRKQRYISVHLAGYLPQLFGK